MVPTKHVANAHVRAALHAKLTISLLLLGLSCCCRTFTVSCIRDAFGSVEPFPVTTFVSSFGSLTRENAVPYGGLWQLHLHSEHTAYTSYLAYIARRAVAADMSKWNDSDQCDSVSPSPLKQVMSASMVVHICSFLDVSTCLSWTSRGILNELAHLNANKLVCLDTQLQAAQSLQCLHWIAGDNPKAWSCKPIPRGYHLRRSRCVEVKKALQQQGLLCTDVLRWMRDSNHHATICVVWV